MKKSFAAALTAMLALSTGCSAASTGHNDSASKSTHGGGLPDVATIDNVTSAVQGDMKGKRIAYIPIAYKGFSLTENWGSTMKRTFDSLGAKFEVYDPNYDTNKMVQIINDLIAKKAADVLIIHNPDVGVLSKQIEAAKNAGIYTVVVNELSNQLGDIYVGADFNAVAAALAKRVVADCNARSAPKSVALIDGSGQDGASLAFAEGTKSVFGPAGYKIVTTAHSDYQNAKAQAAATSIIQQQKKNICALVVNFDLNSLAVAKAVEDAERGNLIGRGDVGVYSYGVDENWCQALKAGKVTAGVAYNVPAVGIGAALAVQQLIEAGAAPGSSHLASFVDFAEVDKTNVDSVGMACYKNN